jgi:CxxC motif-containing protein (DUF1111 family)
LIAFAAFASTLLMLAECRRVRADQGTDRSAYAQPVTAPGAFDIDAFRRGKAEFAARWVAPFLSGGHWGRGPQSNAESCLDCHPGNGRGRIPAGPQEAPFALVLRLGLDGGNDGGGPRPHPAYGPQLDRHGTLGKLIEEGDFRIRYRYNQVVLGDGSTIELRRPIVDVVALWFGPLGESTRMSPRMAQPVFGLGLLEGVRDATLDEIARSQHHLGFNGRPNRVRDEATGATVTGRFGHKAIHPSLRQQVAAAFYDEIGVTSELFPQDQCWPLQAECKRLERLSVVELQAGQLDAVTHYLRMLAPPPRRNRDDAQVLRGELLFEQARCAVCHLPELPSHYGSGDAAHNATTIQPYTDLLLHDMGDGLRDGRREFVAGPRDWRTAPLWGLGLRRQVNGNDALLHDGRARSVAEAIMWHGGDAEVSRRAFSNMSQNERQALVRFVESL